MAWGVNGGRQDNPVGVGYSYSEDPSALVTTDRQAAADATALLKALAGEVPGLPSSPLFLVGESYGGKFAATLGVSVAEAIRSGDLKLTLGGVALGDSWISPGDFAVSYAPLLLSVSRLDDNAGDVVKKEAETVKEQVAAGQLPAAQKTWTDLLDLIDSKGASVDVYNFMRDSGMEPVLTASNAHATKYSTYLGRREAEIGSNSNSIDGIMNGAIKKKLKIIPKDLKWQEASIAAFNALLNEFMKPRISEVDQLLSYGVNVTVYNGQLDVICSTMGAEEWVKKLKWDGLNNFLSLPRQPLH